MEIHVCITKLAEDGLGLELSSVWRGVTAELWWVGLNFLFLLEYELINTNE